MHGYSAAQTGAAYSRARVLCERLGEAEPLVATLSGEFVYYFVRGDYRMMRRLTDEARQVSERLPNPVIRLASHRLAGITAMHFGAFAEARSEFEAILQPIRPAPASIAAGALRSRPEGLGPHLSCAGPLDPWAYPSKRVVRVTRRSNARLSWIRRTSRRMSTTSPARAWTNCSAMSRACKLMQKRSSSWPIGTIWVTGA